jgi:hypothetical protein
MASPKGKQVLPDEWSALFARSTEMQFTMLEIVVAIGLGGKSFFLPRALVTMQFTIPTLILHSTMK